MTTDNSNIIENEVLPDDAVMNDVLLKDLAIVEDLTVRAVNACLCNELHTLFNILDFYKLKGSFKNLRNCGKKTNIELQVVCKKYLPFYPECVKKNDLYEISYSNDEISSIENTITDISLEDLANVEDLTVRAVNTCLYNDLYSLFNILDYYILKGSFKSLRNCGKKTYKKLQEVVEKYIHLIRKYDDSNALCYISSNEIKINDLSLNKLALLYNLSSRTINICKRNDLDSLNKIFNYFKENRDFSSLLNSGSRTEKELQNVCNALIEKIHKLKKTQIFDKFSSIQKNQDQSFFNKTFKNFFIYKEIQIHDLFDGNNKLKIFSLFDLLIKTDNFFNKVDKAIFNSYYNNQLDKSTTLESLGKSINLTKEGVRLRKEKLLKNIQQKFIFVSNFELNEVINYGINGSEDFYILDNSVFDSILTNENVSFKGDFICFIFAVLFKQSHVLVGANSLLAREIKGIWKFQYLIKEKLCSEFDFEKFIEDVYLKINDKIVESYSLHFNGYLFDFFKTEKKADLDEICTVCESLMFFEFNKVVNIDGFIEFDKNTYKKVYQYYFEILEEQGEFMKVSEIAKVASIKFPFLDTKESAIRGILNKEKKKFIFLGRSSTYGLKKWEIEKENVKGGTIRNIVEDFLKIYEEPQRIINISTHVLVFRPKSNEKSIFLNLKQDSSGTFVFFKNSLVGLSYKKYNDTFLLEDSSMIEKANWNERYTDLIEFVNLNNRLPFSSGCPEGEIRLYRWFKIQFKKINNGDLENNKCNLINVISNKFENNSKSQKSRIFNSEKYIELKQFVIKNRRLPSANKGGEETLYQFFYKQRKNFEQGKLELPNEINFIEIAKIIQTNKYENQRK